MPALIAYEITVMSFTVILASVYFYLYGLNGHRFLCIWALGWVVFALRSLFDILAILGHQSAVLDAAILASVLFSGLLIIWGTYVFLEKKVPVYWLSFALIVSVCSAAGLWGGLPPFINTFPSFVFTGVAFVWTGILFLGHPDIKGMGKSVTGWVFILSGVNVGVGFYFRFLLQAVWSAPWGLFITSFLKMLGAVGILLVYFKKSRQDLDRSERSFQLMTENARDVIYRYRLQPPGFECISPSIASVIGYTPEEFYADSLFYKKIVHPDDWSLLEENTETAMEMLKGPATLRCIAKDGRTVWFERRNMAFVYDSKGIAVAVEGIARDITEQKRVENELAEAKKRADREDKMALLGTMAAGIVHEINQPLNALRLIVDGMLYWHKRGKHYEQGEIMGELEGISRQVGRMDKIIKRIHSFHMSRNLEMFEPCDLNGVVVEALENIKGQLQEKGISVKKYLKTDLPMMLGERVRMEEIIVNLSVNAIQSLEGVGNKEKEIIFRTFTENQSIVLEVLDNGSGIKEEYMEKVFEPYFTTKEKCGGTGLGLSIVDNIVNSLNGQISVRNNDKGGAIFRIEFPIHKDEIEQTVAGGSYRGYSAC